MLVLGFNYATDDAQMLSHEDTHAPGAWMFLLRSFTSLPLLEAAADALGRLSFDKIKFEVDIVPDENPKKNKMGTPTAKRRPGRPRKDEDMKRRKTY